MTLYKFVPPVRRIAFIDFGILVYLLYSVLFFSCGLQELNLTSLKFMELTTYLQNFKCIFIRKHLP